MTDYELWSLIIAGAALLVSIFAIVHAVRTTRRQSKADERLRGLQEELAAYHVDAEQRRRTAEAHAELRAYLQRDGRNARIIIRNTGGADAAAIHIHVISLGTGNSALIPNDVERKLPITTLAPDEECPFVADISGDSYPPFEYTIQWTDPDEAPRKYTGKLYG